MTARPAYLSVIVPTHNVDSWVGECLQSILSQSYEWLEVIVVDDHSDDGTVALVQDFVDNDSRVSLIRADDRGGANARNLGVAVAGGDYLVFADGDDIVPQGAYRAMVRSLEASGSDLVIGDFLKFSPTRTWRPSTNWPAYGTTAHGVDLAAKSSLIRGRACWNKMFRLDFWRAQGILFPEVARSNDIVPMVTALTTARGIDIVPDFVYLYRERVGDSSMTSAAGTVRSVLSYFSQEVECGRLLALMGEKSIMSQYGSLILMADGWVHLTRFLAAVDDTASRSGKGDLCNNVAELIALIPAYYFNRANVVHQVIFTLVAARRLDLAVLVHRTLTDLDRGESAPPEFRARWIEIAQVVSDVLDGSHTLAAQILQVELIKPLLLEAPTMLDPMLLERMRQVSAFAAALPKSAIGNPDANTIMDAAFTNSPGRVRHLAMLRNVTAVQLGRPRLIAGLLILEGSLTGLPMGGSAVVTASRRGSSESEVLATLRPRNRASSERGESLGIEAARPVAWRRTIRPTALRSPGTWEVRVTVASHDGTQMTSPLRSSDPLFQVPANRFARVVVMESPRSNAAVLIASRRPIGLRLVTVLARRMPTLARSVKRVVKSNFGHSPRR